MFQLQTDLRFGDESIFAITERRYLQTQLLFPITLRTETADTFDDASRIRVEMCSNLLNTSHILPQGSVLGPRNSFISGRDKKMYNYHISYCQIPWVETWRGVWRTAKNISLTKFSDDLFLGQIVHFDAQNFLMTFFSHRLYSIGLFSISTV